MICEGKKSGNHRYACKDMPSGSLELNHISDLLIADVIVPPAINIKKHMNSQEALEFAGEIEAK